MLLQTDNMNQTISTIESEKIDFTVDESALSHIMSVLTNLYSDPISSVVREITTNAIDSHLISGQTAPVEIYSPTRLSQNFVVQDHGSGMSANNIRELYSRYGASTKRGNNIEAGQLGLGSKSPFAYTDQFTIVAVKDGEKTTAILGRNSSGSAEINIVSVSSTSEGNGVKMTIPVKSADIYTFNNAIESFAKYVEPGLVTVNSNPNTARDTWVDLGDGFFVTSTQSWGEHRVVMGNVAYPIGGMDWTGNTSIAYYCGMGEVTFAPSREELIYNVATKNKVDWIKSTAKEKVQKYVSDQAANAKTTYDKFQVVLKYQRWIPGIMNGVVPAQSEIFRFVSMPPYADSSASTAELTYNNIVRYERSFAVMKNFTSQRWTRLHSNKVLEKDSTLASKNFIVFDQVADDYVKDLFGSNVVILDWNDFRSVKVQGKASGTRKPKFSYDGFSRRENVSRGIADIRTYERVLYVAKSELSTSKFNVQHLKKNECVVLVPRSEQEAFAKRMNAESFHKVCNERRDHVMRCLNGKRIQTELAGVISSDHDFVKMLRSRNEITNKEFVKDALLVAKREKWERVARKWRIHGVIPAPIAKQEKYLLLSTTSLYQKSIRDHIIIYINALEEK